MFNSRPFLKPARPGIRKRELLLRKGLNWKKWTAGWEAHAGGSQKPSTSVNSLEEIGMRALPLDVVGKSLDEALISGEDDKTAHSLFSFESTPQ